VLLAFVAIAAFFLITEHTAHVLGFLPFLSVLLCPLLHLFLHARQCKLRTYAPSPSGRGGGEGQAEPGRALAVLDCHTLI
jgi:Protein of unknown function (DUF2933)